jgi:ceroid-lipofuscinosis MFS transporter 7
VARAYIAKVTTESERTTHNAIFLLFQTVGFVVGPALQAAFAPIGTAPIPADSAVIVNMFTAAG